MHIHTRNTQIRDRGSTLCPPLHQIGLKDSGCLGAVQLSDDIFALKSKKMVLPVLGGEGCKLVNEHIFNRFSGPPFTLLT